MTRSATDRWQVLVLAMSLISGSAVAAETCEGPAGGYGGNTFSDLGRIPPGHMHEVRIRSGDYVDTIQAVIQQGAQLKPLQPHGGSGGDPSVLSLMPMNISSASAAVLGHSMTQSF